MPIHLSQHPLTRSMVDMLGGLHLLHIPGRDMLHAGFLLLHRHLGVLNLVRQRRKRDKARNGNEVEEKEGRGTSILRSLYRREARIIYSTPPGRYLLKMPSSRRGASDEMKFLENSRGRCCMVRMERMGACFRVEIVLDSRKHSFHSETGAGLSPHFPCSLPLSQQLLFGLPPLSRCPRTSRSTQE